MLAPLTLIFFRQFTIIFTDYSYQEQCKSINITYEEFPISEAKTGKVTTNWHEFMSKSKTFPPLIKFTLTLGLNLIKYSVIQLLDAKLTVCNYICRAAIKLNFA